MPRHCSNISMNTKGGILRHPSEMIEAFGRVVIAGMLVAMLAAPRLHAQTAEDFQKLKGMVEEMQKTIEAQNKRIAELETNRVIQPLTPTNAAAAAKAQWAKRLEANSPSIQTMEKVA